MGLSRSPPPVRQARARAAIASDPLTYYHSLVIYCTWCLPTTTVTPSHPSIHPSRLRRSRLKNPTAAENQCRGTAAPGGGCVPHCPRTASGRVCAGDVHNTLGEIVRPVQVRVPARCRSLPMPQHRISHGGRDHQGSPTTGAAGDPLDRPKSCDLRAWPAPRVGKQAPAQ